MAKKRLSLADSRRAAWLKHLESSSRLRTADKATQDLAEIAFVEGWLGATRYTQRKKRRDEKRLEKQETQP
jgi:hypothetical protein